MLMLYQDYRRIPCFSLGTTTLLQTKGPEIATFKTPAGPFDEPVSKAAQRVLGNPLEAVGRGNG
jgi:hypothetical protein